LKEPEFGIAEFSLIIMEGMRAHVPDGNSPEHSPMVYHIMLFHRRDHIIDDIGYQE
jgi:hypothetical protein